MKFKRSFFGDPHGPRDSEASLCGGKDDRQHDAAGEPHGHVDADDYRSCKPRVDVQL